MPIQVAPQTPWRPRPNFRTDINSGVPRISRLLYLYIQTRTKSHYLEYVPSKDSLGSPGSPRVGVKYHWESKDTSFDTIESSKEESSYREAHYKEQFLLHDTLKTIAVRESTQRASNMVINRYICLTIVLTNLMSIGFSVLGSILVMKSVSPCNPHFYNDPQARFQDTIKQGPDSLTKHVELQSVDYPVLTLKSDAEMDKDADTHTDLTADDADTYQIHIKVAAPENQTIDHGHEDFWLN